MSAYSDAVLALSPDSYWRFEGASPLADSGSAGITLTATGSPVRAPSLVPSENAAADNAYDLDGSSMYLQAGDAYEFSAGQDWTIALWVKVEGTTFGSSFRRIIEKRDQAGDNAGYLLYGSATANITSDIDPGVAAPEGFTDGPFLDQDEVHLVAWTWDQATLTWTLYIDGVEEANKTDWTNVTGFPASSANFTIGASSGGSPTFEGIVDDVAVWDDVALTSTQVGDLWDAGQAEPATAMWLTTL